MGTATEPRQVKARKRHRCYWCGEWIEVGDTYTRWTWFDGGTADTVRVHPECGSAWQSLPWMDAEQVSQYEQCRGCTCERGRCECGQAAHEARLAKEGAA